ncbi:MAG: hypothetical protein CSB46_11095 [Micrococcales bacterium]|nr:MAG: hypothetical protein CSB46_11095 [Micrococcales bacterium]
MWRWWLEHRPDAQLEIWYTTQALPGMPAALPSREGARVLRPNDSLTSPTWEQVPAVRHHVLVCRGPRCSAKGSSGMLASLGAELHERDMLDSEVLVTQTGCLYPCNRAPVVAIQPEMEWVGPVHESDVIALADQLERYCRDGTRATNRGISPPTETRAD